MAAQVAGIIGWPVAHSLSPAIHTAGFAAARLAWVYGAFPVRPERVGEALAGMRALGIRGLNVTMPHKQAVIPHLDALTGEAEQAGAVNTIIRDGDRLIGENTDGSGFVRFLRGGAAFEPDGCVALILGGGGAARAVAAALGREGARLRIAARKGEQARAVALIAGGETLPWDPDDLTEAGAAADLVINATPAQGRDLPLGDASFRPGQVVCDLLYSPPETPLLRYARKVGARGHNGIGMLLEQAILSFEAWTGVEAPRDVMAGALEAALRASPARE